MYFLTSYKITIIFIVIETFYRIINTDNNFFIIIYSPNHFYVILHSKIQYHS